LENRTTSYKEYTLDEIKEIYEEKGKQIDMLFEYYNNLEEVFSSSVYPSPYELLLLNNVSKIYNTLNYSKELLEEWYKHISNTRKRRIVLSHNHLSLDHFLDCKDAKVINFDYASYKSPIYDFAYFYKNHYHELDMLSLFTTYQRKYLYTDDELLLFFIEIIIPPKINLKKNTYENTLLIHKLITYIDSTRDFILKKQKKQQEEH
jgi:thiamine kinase-like enzyme